MKAEGSFESGSRLTLECSPRIKPLSSSSYSSIFDANYAAIICPPAGAYTLQALHPTMCSQKRQKMLCDAGPLHFSVSARRHSISKLIPLILPSLWIQHIVYVCPDNTSGKRHRNLSQTLIVLTFNVLGWTSWGLLLGPPEALAKPCRLYLG